MSGLATLAEYNFVMARLAEDDLAEALFDSIVQLMYCDISHAEVRHGNFATPYTDEEFKEYKLTHPMGIRTMTMRKKLGCQIVRIRIDLDKADELNDAEERDRLMAQYTRKYCYEIGLYCLGMGGHTY